MKPKERIREASVYQAVERLRQYGAQSYTYRLATNPRILGGALLVAVLIGMVRILLTDMNDAIKFLSFAVLFVAFTALFWPYTKPVFE